MEKPEEWETVLHNLHKRYAVSANQMEYWEEVCHAFELAASLENQQGRKTLQTAKKYLQQKQGLVLGERDGNSGQALREPKNWRQEAGAGVDKAENFENKPVDEEVERDHSDITIGFDDDGFGSDSVSDGNYETDKENCAEARFSRESVRSVRENEYAEIDTDDNYGCSKDDDYDSSSSVSSPEERESNTSTISSTSECNTREKPQNEASHASTAAQTRIHDSLSSNGKCCTSYLMNRYDNLPLSTVSFVANQSTLQIEDSLSMRSVDCESLQLLKRTRRNKDDFVDTLNFLFSRFQTGEWTYGDFKHIPTETSTQTSDNAIPGGIIRHTSVTTAAGVVERLVSWQMNLRKILEHSPKSDQPLKDGDFLTWLSQQCSPILIVTTPTKLRRWYDHLAKDPFISIYKHCSRTKRDWDLYRKPASVSSAFCFLKDDNDPVSIPLKMHRCLSCNVILTTFTSLGASECQLPNDCAKWSTSELPCSRTSAIYQVFWNQISKFFVYDCICVLLYQSCFNQCSCG